jgi:hypothetical protein
VKGVLTVEQQLNVMSKIWGNDREGYVFLPWIPGTTTNKEERRKGYHEGPSFAWPEERAKIINWLSTHTADDVYFAPCLFEDNRRIEQAAAPERALWADMDEADPQTLPHDLRPTIAWESSPGRYQAVWLLSDGAVGLSWPGRENHRLTMAIGADPSGWDTTQLLRVPGRVNYKFVYKDTNGGKGVQGELLWDGGPRYVVEDFIDLPKVVSADAGNGDADLVDESIVGDVDRHDVWARVRLKVSHRVRELMGFRRESQITENMDRSEILWSISRDLADAGCSAAEIIAVIRPTVWNKYAGRGDEMKQLKALAGKSLREVINEAKAGDGGALEVIGDDKPDIRWLSDVMAVHLRRPRWIVNNVWSEGGCGFIAGDPKSYKSWTALDFAVSIATGAPFLGDPAFSVVGGLRPVLYLQEEDSEIVVRDRLDFIVEGKCAEMHWHGSMSWSDRGGLVWSPPTSTIPLGFHVRTGFISSDPGWQAWLAETIAEGQFGQVIIDTMGTTAGDVDTDRAPELMSKILRPLREISSMTGAGIAVVHHNRKGTEGQSRGGQRMLGSVALHAWVDDALYVHSREQLKSGITKVRIERESKASTEHRWTLEVPRMGVGRDGARTVWSPTVGLWDTSADVVTGDTDRPDTGQPVASTPRGGSRPAGHDIAWKVSSMQPRDNPDHRVPFSAIVSGTQKPASQARKQLADAVSNGLMIGDEAGGYRSLTRARD